MNRKILLSLLAAVLLWPAAVLLARQSPSRGGEAQPAKPAPEEFLRAADEVLEEVSRILALPVKYPLKKSLRSREEIRAYVVSEIRADREPVKWEADQKALERFGLLPRDFPLEQFMVDLLTEQIAGLYDPKQREFFIADWIGMGELRTVMSHELVHALQDQHFEIEKWVDAVKPNDDAMSARHAVLEGAGVAGMLDYMLREQKLSTRDLPDLEPLIRAQMGGEMEKNPLMAKAPPYIRDSLLFPYLAGTFFVQHLLKQGQGWSDFNRVFQRPPDSTRQILHPDLYLKGTGAIAVTLPDASRISGGGWKKLDENVMGEFGLHSILQQQLGEERAQQLSPAWSGDLYGIYQHEKTGKSMLLFRLQLDSESSALRFFGVYSEALETKHKNREGLFRRPNFFSFQTPDGGVFLYCRGQECFVMEGGARSDFDALVSDLQWPAAPLTPSAAPKSRIASRLAAPAHS